VWLLISAIFYVWTSLATAKLFVKLGEPAWKGWVPIVNTITLLVRGGYSGVWVVALFFPIVQIAGLVVFCFALHRITVQFGKGVGYTVLAILVYPVWASILGFGPARPGVVAPVPAAAAWPVPPVAPSTVPMTLADAPPPAWPAPVAPTPVAASAPVASPVPVAAPVEAHRPPAAPVAPQMTRPIPPVSPPVPTPTPVAAPAAPPDLWAPPTGPSLTTPIGPLDETMNTGSSPIEATPVPAGKHVNAAVVEDLDDLDKTVISSRRAPVWLLLPEGGTPIRLTASSALLGRNPRAAASAPDAQLVTVPDISKTMSKTHALLTLTDGAWLVTDLDSTNGVLLVSATGVETEVVPGTPTPLTETFLLGELTLTLLPEN
jgi:hypothetical protein